MVIGFGVWVEWEKFVFLIVVVGLVVVCVFVSGGIVFIGLIGLYIVRKLVGFVYCWVMVMVVFFGGLLLLFVDMIGWLII